MRGKMLALAMVLALAAGANAREPWQIGHGPFLTATDVTAHNKFPLDIAGVRLALDSEKPDWAGALALYAYGGNFRGHSLGRFADNYNGRLGAYLPGASRHFGSPSFQNAYLFSALAGTGRFAGASEAERRAALDGGMAALMINYARYELGEASRKAQATPANWSLQNGAPKNWNEVFAFYYGPDGKHSVFEVLSALPNGERLNKQLLAALAEGQTELVAQRWAPDPAARVAETLDLASIALFRDALTRAQGAPDASLAMERARAAGFWLAAAEPIIRLDATRVEIIEKAFAGPADRIALTAAVGALAGIPAE